MQLNLARAVLSDVLIEDPQTVACEPAQGSGAGQPAALLLSPLQVAALHDKEALINARGAIEQLQIRSDIEGTEAHIFFSFLKSRGLEEDFLTFRALAMEACQ